MQARVGQIFGKYRLTQLIGRGGYAEVYLAEHILLDHLQYAVKILTGTNLKDEQRDEFRLEAETITKLQRLSTHIVQISDFDIQLNPDGSNSGIPYIVMEYAQEGTLRQLYPHSTKVPLDRILFYTKQVAEALQCAHDQVPPIVHRDIKPENMLLRTRDHVLLSDFGIAIAGQTGPLLPPQGGSKVVGTATYMAPERLLNRTRRASDQYSLATIVYEWLCGDPPFDGTNQEICLKQLRATPPTLVPICKHVSPEVESVVMRALEKEPDSRYPTVQAFVQALETAMSATLQPAAYRVQPGGNMAQSPVHSPINQVANQFYQPPPSPGLAHHSPLPPAFFAGSTVVGNSSQQTRPLAPPALPPANRLSFIERFRAFFELSSQFARMRRYQSFRTYGYLLNILSGLFIGLVLQNVLSGAVALLFSWLLFALCIRAVERIVALGAGIVLALYWGVVGWFFGGFSANFLQITHESLPQFVALLFFAASAILHIRYATEKNL